MKRAPGAGRSPFALGFGMLLLLAVTALVRLPHVVEPPGRDQGLFLAEASTWLDGGRFYEDIFEHKPVGVIGVYALGVALFGATPAAVQALHASALFATAALLFALARRQGLDRSGSLAASVLYLVFSAGTAFGGFWSSAQVEVFVDPLVVLALLGFLGSAEDPLARRRGAFWGGVAIGVAIAWLKYSCLPLVGLLALLFLPREGVQRQARRRLLGTALVGVCLPALALVAVFAGTGRFESFWLSSVEFNWIHRGGLQAQLPQGFDWLAGVLPFSAALRPLYVAALAGLVLLWLHARGSQRAVRPGRDALWVAGLLLWGIALGEVFFQAKFWVYHYFVLLLPLSLLAGLGLQGAADALRPKVGGVAAWGFVWLVAFALAFPHWRDLGTHLGQREVVSFARGKVDADAVRSGYRWGGEDYDYGDTLAAARRLRRESGGAGTLFVWGFEPSLYWLTGLRPVSRFFYDYPLSRAFGDLAKTHEAQLLAELEGHPPRFFVVVKDDANDLEGIESRLQLGRHPRLVAFLEKHYRSSWQEGDFTTYRRVEVDGGASSSAPTRTGRPLVTASSETRARPRQSPDRSS